MASSVDYLREWNFERQSLEGNMFGLDGSFATRSPDVEATRFAAGVGIKGYMEDRLILELNYGVEFGGDYLGHTASALWTVEF